MPRLHILQSIWGTERMQSDGCEWSMAERPTMIREQGSTGSAPTSMPAGRSSPGSTRPRLAQAGPNDSLTFTCELGPKPYATSGPDGNDLSDRWQDSQMMQDLVADLWSRVEADAACAVAWRRAREVKWTSQCRDIRYIDAVQAWLQEVSKATKSIKGRKGVFVSIRKYHNVVSVEEVKKRVAKEFVPKLKQNPGFQGYYLIDCNSPSSGNIVTAISLFDSREAALASNDAAKHFV